jgi:hypothetical protein
MYQLVSLAHELHRPDVLCHSVYASKLTELPKRELPRSHGVFRWVSSTEMGCSLGCEVRIWGVDARYGCGRCGEVSTYTTARLGNEAAMDSPKSMYSLS